jgi:beta-glucanase (GH16 family)
MSGTLSLVGYHLTFDDEFNSPSDLSPFANSYPWGGTTLPSNDEAENYVPNTYGAAGNPYSVANGALTITASPTPSGGLPYTSGLLSTANVFSQNTGYFEIRAEMPAASGFWPAFWMLPEGAGYPEIDILEQPNNSGTQTDYWNHTTTPTNSSGGFVNTGTDVFSGYHTYGFLWTGTSIQYVFDGQLIGSPQTVPPALAAEQMYLLVNLAVGGPGSWPGQPASGASSTYSIDYIRAYSENPDVAGVNLEPISSPDGVNTSPLLLGATVGVTTPANATTTVSTPITTTTTTPTTTTAATPSRTPAAATTTTPATTTPATTTNATTATTSAATTPATTTPTSSTPTTPASTTPTTIVTTITPTTTVTKTASITPPTTVTSPNLTVAITATAAATPAVTPIILGASQNTLFIATTAQGSFNVQGAGNSDTITVNGVGYASAVVSGTDNAFNVAISGTTIAGSNVGQISFIDGTVDYNVNSPGAQVMRLYDAALGRAPDPVGLAGWVQSIANGTSLTSVAAGFINSAEFQARYPGAGNPTSFVTQLYANVLHRAPDAAGLTGWVTALTSGQDSQAQVLVGFSESAENQATTASSVTNGLYVPNEDAAEVARLYYTALDRPPDLAGLTGWTTQLENGTLNLQQVAAGFTNSAEFQAEYGSLSNTAFVDLLYQNVLGRAPDPGGQANWVNVLNSNSMTRASVVLGFSNSTENETKLAPVIENTGIKFV